MSKNKYKIIILLTLLVLVWKLILYDYDKGFFITEILDHGLKEVIHRFSFDSNLNNEWTINGNIVQYSSFVILVETNLIKIEVLALSNKRYLDTTDLHNNIKCVIKMKNDFKLYITSPYDIVAIPFMETNDIPSTLWKFQCFYKFSNQENFLDSKDLAVSLVDVNDFKSNKKNSIFLNNKAVLSINYIQYQKPAYFNLFKPKKKAVAHCVHLLRGLDHTRTVRILNWIELQRKIGIKKIRLYVLDVEESVIQLIKKKYSQDFIEIIFHHTNLKDVCKKQIERLENYPNSLFYQKLYDYCKTAFEKHYNISKILVLNAHERINTNDCFYNYKYEYEYVTNYDIDEIILPRNIDYNDNNNANCENSLKNSQNYTYNIYDYADRLFSKYGKKKTSCISFENVMFLPNNKNLDTFLLNLYNNKKHLTTIVLHGEENKTVQYKCDSKTKFSYSKTIYKYSNLYKCLKNKYKSYINDTVDGNFNNAIASLMNMREGKSIFNTDNTEGINQHYASIEKSFTYRIKIPLKLGYASHFRESFNKFFYNQQYPIDFVLVDIEYYLFLINSFLKENIK
jgi:hypothetical protein